MVLAFVSSLGFVSLRSEIIFELALETVDMKLRSKFQPSSCDSFFGNSDRSFGGIHANIDRYIHSHALRKSAGMIWISFADIEIHSIQRCASLFELCSKERRAWRVARSALISQYLINSMSHDMSGLFLSPCLALKTCRILLYLQSISQVWHVVL